MKGDLMKPRSAVLMLLAVLLCCATASPASTIPAHIRDKIAPALLELIEYPDAAKIASGDTIITVIIVAGETAPLKYVAGRLGRLSDFDINDYPVCNMLVARLAINQIAPAVTDVYDHIDHVWPNEVYECPGPPSPRIATEPPMLDSSFAAVGVTKMWERGYTGAGIRVGILDSGWDRDHPDLVGRVVAENDFVPDTVLTRTGDIGDGDNDEWADEGTGHGTAMAGIIGANGQFKGVAFDADLVVAKISEVKQGARDDFVVYGLQWMWDPDEDGSIDDAQVDVANYSFFRPQNPSYIDPVSHCIRYITSKGGIVVTGSGNSGECITGSPSSLPEIISCGALEQSLTWWNSSSGYVYHARTPDEYIRPDITAPGFIVVTALGGGYKNSAGTSNAAAFTTGAISLLLQANPHLKGRPDLIQMILRKTARHVDLDGNPSDGTANHRYGYGIIDVSRFTPESVAHVLANWIGDVNGDLRCTDTDVTRILRKTVRDTTNPHVFKKYADVTGDGSISAYDASWVLRKSLDSTLTLPVEELPPISRIAAFYTDTLKLGDVRTRPGSTVSVPLIGGINGRYSIQIAYTFDAAIIEPDTSGFLIDLTGDGLAKAVDFNVRNDTVYTSFAFAEPVMFSIETDTIARFVFRVCDEAEMGAVSSLRILGIDATKRTSCDEEAPIRWYGSMTVGHPTAISTETLPRRFTVHQSLPNPFNPSTSIRFDLPHAGVVKANVYNILGQHVRTLTHRRFTAGTHTLTWNGRDTKGRPIASGVYILRMVAQDETRSIRMTLVR
jgi:subtilisin family serine protease